MSILLALALLTHIDLRMMPCALPAISVSIGSAPGAVALAMTSYSIAFATGQFLFGALADRWGRLQVIRLAMVGFGIAVVVSGLAMTTGQFVAARCVVGAFAGGVVPLTLVLVGDTREYDARQTALARVAMVTSIAFTISSAVGGLITEYVSWRILLFGTGAASVLAGATLFAFTPAPQNKKRRALSYAQIVRQPRARFVYFLVFFEGILLWGTMTYLGGVIHRRYDLNYFATGMVLASMGIGTIGCGALIGQLRRRLSETAVGAGGAFLLALGFALMIPNLTPLLFVVALVILGAGFVALITTLQVRATGLSTRSRASVMSLFALCRYTGIAVGSALFGRVIDLDLVYVVLVIAASGFALMSLVVGVSKALTADASFSPD